MKMFWLSSVCALAFAVPAAAQQAAPAMDEAGAPQGASPAAGGDAIIITATRRNQALSDVPLAVSAVTADMLVASGASDIRQLNQLSPSLLVSSTASEAGAGVARIRGIGTVGDNPGLESSVATFVDGVYRSRSAVALTELGAIDRIEVLRGPQGTLFGRNASAGLIHVITTKPSFQDEGTAEFSYGNYDYRRAVLGLTGPFGQSQTMAYRIDGVWTKRDGFLKEDPDYAGSSGRRFNDRDRWLVRGQLLYTPNDDLEVRLIGDYSDRDEECCAAVYLPTANVSRGSDGGIVRSPSTVAAILRGLGGVVNEDGFARRVAVTPGRSYRQDVRDWGLSGQVDYNLGAANLTSITAYRDNRYRRGQDNDFTNLDLLYRPDDGSDFIRFRTFSQELRLQGEAFDGKLDWLVGGYYANERLDVGNRLSYGSDFDRYVAGLYQSSPATAAFPGFNDLRGFVSGALVADGASAGLVDGVIAPAIQNISVSDTGTDDRYRQKSRNFAFFTHNVFNVTDSVAVTLGLRYTNERKRLNASFASTVPDAQARIAGSIQALNQLAAANPAVAPLANAAIGTIEGLAGPTTPVSLLRILSGFNGTLAPSTRKEDEWSGTAAISWKPVPSLLTYASYSRGYKAGGFNLDRSALNLAAPSLTDDLQFKQEKVDAYEVGLKWNGPGIDINIAGFWEDFSNFQLNNFQGLTFLVENVNGCSALAGGPAADSDTAAGGTAAASAAALSGACDGKLEPGVRSRGVEVEAFMRPLRDVNAALGFTLADTRYRDDLAGANGRPLPTSLFQLPGRRLSNAPLYTVTGSAGWTPPIGSKGYSALVYADFRYQSDFNTGSDLNFEKIQDQVMVVNARLGLRGPDQAWSLELWAQNLFDADYTQVAFNQPGQGSGETRAVLAGQQALATRLYGAFLAEPRTFGVTVRTKF